MNLRTCWYFLRHLEALCVLALEPVMTPVHLKRRDAENDGWQPIRHGSQPPHDLVSCWCCCWTCGPDADSAMVRP